MSTLTHAFSPDTFAFSFSRGNIKSSAPDKRITTNRPWGNVGTPKPATMYQPLPPPANYYPGAANDSGWYTAALPGNSTATAGLPSVEVDLGGSAFYEQQNIVYTVRVVSDGNIKTLKPELPRIEGATLEQLDGPVVSIRTSRHNKRQIINSYRYKLMPLRSGEIVIPAIRFVGTHAQNRQFNRGPGVPASSFSIVADKVLTLQVQPADSAVNPWLPLHDLKLQTNLLQKGPATAGEPVTLVVELNARGALGNQLPSLERQLESKHYRIYRDDTAIKNGFSAKGDYLTGNRKETYTIIPLEDGLIRLPEVSVAWWDVDTHTAMLAGSPFGYAGTGSARNRAAASSGEQSMFPVYFWAPLIITLSLIAGFWLGSWHRTRPLVKASAVRLAALGRLALQQGRRVGTRLSSKLSSMDHLSQLRMGLNRLRMGFALLMPRSIKLWMCTRCLDAEDNPDAWCADFKSRVCQHLNISMHAPLTQIAEQIIAVSPQAEPARLRALAHSLDGAIYGGSSLDFIAWKREFVHQMRPHLLRRRRSPRRTKAMLPALNPHLA
jgi:hypothetical protein